MGKRTVKNYPSPRLMETIGATNQSTPEAIGELVANCFDARYQNNRVNIFIDLSDDEIKVIDDGKGMTDSVLEHAVCIAEDMSRYFERGEGSKGHFGMGFKTSCSTLGKQYEIFTRPVESSIEYHVAFDIDDYGRRAAGVDAWDVEIEDYPVDIAGPLGNSPHGTAFVIKKLNDKNLLKGAVLDYLSEAFKGHIESGDTITIFDGINRLDAIPKVRDFIPKTRIPISINCGPGNSMHIEGWVALDKITHNDGLYGFNIFRHGQLVDSWNKDWFKPHLMTSRIIGEVSMDFLDATFYKQGLQQTELWTIASERMKEFLKPIVKASRAISRKGNINNHGEKRKIVATLMDECGVADNSNNIEQETEGIASEENIAPQKQKSINDTVKTIVHENELELRNGTIIPIMLAERTANARVDAPFDYLYEDALEDNPTLTVVVYTDHPLFLQGKDNQKTINILATADAIYRVLVEHFDYDPGEAFNVKNRWIAKRIEVGR